MVHVFLYVPNLIGYARVISGLVSMTYGLSDPWMFVWIYTFSMGLDAVDGVAARALNQSSSAALRPRHTRAVGFVAHVWTLCSHVWCCACLQRRGLAPCWTW